MKKAASIVLIFIYLSNYAQVTTLYNFSGGQFGSNPYGSLISDGTYLYGLTQSGGDDARGNIFKIKLDGTGYVNLHTFSGLNGSFPYGSLITDGTYLYGATRNGGSSFVNPSEPDNGIVFKIMPDGTNYTIIYEFDGAQFATANVNGGMPNGGELYLENDYLFGLTYTKDVVFKVKTDGTGFARLFDFSSPNGQRPIGSLISDGTFLYGVTEAGGSNNWGTLFKIKPDGTGYANIYEFFNSTLYSNPHGSLLSDGTYFYGMAVNCIYKIKPDGTNFDTIVIFRGASNGSLNNFNTYNQGTLIYDGVHLFGMTNEGGLSNKGIVFKVKPDGTGFTKLVDFTGTNGQTPHGSLIIAGNDVYGMTTFGGTFNKGTIFKIANQISGLNESNGKNSSIRVFPNPAKSHLNIEINNFDFKNTKVVIMNTIGKIVFKTEISSNSIDISNLESGIYFIILKDTNNFYSAKFIKQ